MPPAQTNPAKQTISTMGKPDPNDFYAKDLSDDEEDRDRDGDYAGDWRSTAGGVAHHYLLLIDCHADMWKAKSNSLSSSSTLSSSTCWVEDVLVFAEQFARSAVKESVELSTGKRNGLCVVLYGTKLCKPEARDSCFEEKQKENY